MEIPETLKTLIEEFLAERRACSRKGGILGQPTVCQEDLADLRHIINMLIEEKWQQHPGIEPSVGAVVVDQTVHERFEFRPVPRIKTGHIGDDIDPESDEFGEFIQAVSKNNSESEQAIQKALQMMRIYNGRAVQKRQWDQQRLKSAISSIEQEMEKKDG